ncbi:signal peptidase II [Xanthobacter agilis]|jgi:signal peptidase II|uniref:Lipoprotein signal peptidase n=1 Tax=Xanthobacter agilis TaxID=47492 RepID=A0ABU0LED9_XANAG|nr:signal peptidase II [Xanthobacter agilis]MDQ0505501.1 signal peptidase II [Xanthobacter agilis]
MSRIRLGLLTAFLVLVADQVTKTWAIGFMAAHGPGLVPVAPILDLVALWNAGISYGLFPQGETGRWVLVAIKVVAALAFALWLTRAQRPAEALGLGLLIGGALGNAVDRVVYGAVFDFISLHAGGYRWYVFNVADIAVVGGVGLLLYDAFFGRASKTPPSPTPMRSQSEAEREP